MDAGNRLLAVQPDHLLLFGGLDVPTPFAEPMERTTLFLMERRRDGGTRLLMRTRGYTYGALGLLYNLFYEIYDYLQGMAQLNNIKERAETMAHLRMSSAI